MIDILYIVLPIYLAITLGFGLVRLKAFSPEDMKSLGRFVLNVAFPALIFHAMATRPLADVLNTDYMLAYAVAGLGILGVSYGLFTSLGWDARTRAAGVMGASCPNNGFVGYAFFLLTMPDLAPVILALNLLVENLLIVPICLMLLRGAEASGHGGIARLARIFWSVLKMPLIVALILGTLVNLSGVQLPVSVMTFVGILAASASALGLVVIGGSLASLPRGTNLSQAFLVTVGKILIFPAIAFLSVTALSGLGVLVLDDTMRAALVLSASMPTFTIFVVFAQRLQMEGFASLVLLGTTTSAFVSLSLILVWMT